MTDISEFMHLCPKLRRYALKLTRHVENSEDLLQDTLLRAWERRAQCRGDVFGWLKTIMFYRFCDGRRSQPVVSIEECDGMEPEYPDASESHCVARDILRGLERMSTTNRVPFEMHRLHGMEYREIAHALHLPMGTVKSRIARAHAELEKVL